MKLLLTSLGLTNASIRNALVELTRKPIEETTTVFVPTAMHAIPGGGDHLWQELNDHRQIGWKPLAILELTAMPSLSEEHWLAPLRDADVIMVGGGNTPYLSYWFQKSGFADVLPDLLTRSVYIGASAGSMVMTQSFGINRERLLATGVYADEQYGDVAPMHYGSDFTMKLVPFTLRPQLNAPYFVHVTLRDMEEQAARADVPLYAIDDQTAIKVRDGRIEVVSEGEWKLIDARLGP
jgi:dipeptidase E